MEKNLDTIRHSVSHVAAAAVKQLFPGVKFAIGPTIGEGFYYDFDLPRALTPADLPKIEKRMAELIKQNLPFERYEVPFQKAVEMASEQPYKRELINELKSKNETISFYKVDGFVDLCRGPHIANTKEINPKAFKLIKIAGAYWRGNEKNKMLQRIYGTAFLTENELKKYLEQKEEAEKRDHRKLGYDLELFTFSDLIGKGLPLYTPRGSLLRRMLNDYVEEIQTAQNYEQVWTPQIAKAKLFKISGHYDKYREGMFRVISNYSDEEFYLKPMNCPQHTQIYNSRPRSYKDLPLRYTDFAMLYRDEKPGELSGLARVRSFSQDDCHIFCREDQVDKEIDTMLAMIKKIMKTFNLKYRYRLSTRDLKNTKQYLGDPKIWDKAEKWAVKIMQRNKIDYFDAPGEAAFYAPKMDLMATDALGREWQLSTIQIDYVMPERFGLEYTDEKGQKKRPVMLHRAIIGSPERFLMVLIEQYAGAFPVWLAPIQVQIIPVGSKHVKFSEKLGQQFRKENLRVEVDDVNETVGYKIRKAEKMRVPYMLVIGDKEMKAKSLAIRDRGKKAVRKVALKKFIAEVKKKIEDKK
ncbi:MAG: threonine--tRNA ligase [Patescibacteria group bacterium]